VSVYSGSGLNTDPSYHPRLRYVVVGVRVTISAWFSCGYITLIMETTMKLITGKTKIVAAITAVAASGVKWENDVQVLALSVMAHSAKNREVSLMNQLIDAMPNGARTNALRAYFDKFSCATFVEAMGKNPAHFAFDKDKKHDHAGAAETTWSKFKPETPYQPIDIHSQLNRLLSRVEKDDKTEYDEDTVQGIRDLVAKSKPVFEPAH